MKALPPCQNGHLGLWLQDVLSGCFFAMSCGHVVYVSAQLKVSRATAAKAALILKNEGILSGGQGRKYVIIRAKNISDKKPALSAVGQVAVKLREYIKTAQARVRIMLPVMELTKTPGFSHRTVCDTLRMLVKEGVVEKYGKFYAIAQEQE
jgi:DNA-binding GntR family transcriptional regulator